MCTAQRLAMALGLLSAKKWGRSSRPWRKVVQWQGITPTEKGKQMSGFSNWKWKSFSLYGVGRREQERRTQVSSTQNFIWTEENSFVLRVSYYCSHLRSYIRQRCNGLIFIHFFGYLVFIREIKEVRRGLGSKDFDRNADAARRRDPNRCLVILYGTEFKLKTLSLVGKIELLQIKPT